MLKFIGNFYIYIHQVSVCDFLFFSFFLCLVLVSVLWCLCGMNLEVLHPLVFFGNSLRRIDFILFVLFCFVQSLLRASGLELYWEFLNF